MTPVGLGVPCCWVSFVAAEMAGLTADRLIAVYV